MTESNRLIIISGCSGGGKSTLLRELARRGYAVVEEPGRRIVEEERAGSGAALPWVDLAAFAQRALDLALSDWETARRIDGPIFFDRGLVDAAVALQFATGKPALNDVAGRRYHHQVFMTPPWPEIYRSDVDRPHGLEEAVQEYERLMAAFPTLDYDVEIMAKGRVECRADFVLNRLQITQAIANRT